MRNIILLIVFLLVSCNKTETNNPESNKINQVDSILLKSIDNVKISDTVQRKSDSVTQQKVVKVIKNIQYLTNTVEKLKIEKLQLSKELKISKQNVRVDTVFVETKKSFWGREKKTVTTKSDTQNIETIDSTSTKVLDTISDVKN